MSETTQNQGTNPLDDFLDVTETSENPFENTDATGGETLDPFSQTDSQTQEAIPPQQTAPAQAKTAADPFAAALKKAEAGSEQRMIEELAAKPPVFSYTTVKEPITDTEKTFDALREQYQTDFPELSEKKKVSWTVTYGKVVQPVPNPEGTKVYVLKTEIEKSKPFLDGLKKAKNDKDKNPDCTVTPRVTAQSKGEALTSYKGVYPTLEAAVANPKPIMLVPARDGKVYEIRSNEIGMFITPVIDSVKDGKRGSLAGPLSPENGPPELSRILPGFALHLPKIPYFILESVINLFRIYAEKKLEVLAHILFDKTDCKYRLHIPKQTVTATGVDVVDAEESPQDCLRVMDVHSHHHMPAKFSLTDDLDEKATGIYAVIGRTDKLFPDIRVRISNGGKFLEIDPRDVFESSKLSSIPAEWESVIHEPEAGDGA